MRTYSSLVLVMALWGSAFASSKLALRDVAPQAAAFLRFAIGALILLAWLGLRGRGGPRLPRRDRAAAAGLGLLGVFGYNVLFFAALSLAPSADGSVIVPATAPVITIAATALAGRRRLPVRRMLGLGGAVAGAAVFFAAIPSGGGHRLTGDLLFLGSAACWAGYTVLGAPLLRRLPALAVTTYATGAGALALGVVAAPALGRVPWSHLNPGFWLNQAYLSVLPTALAYVMYYRAVRITGPATASSAMFLVPVFGLACAWLLVGESITAGQAAGAGLMLAGAWLATSSRDRPSAGSIDPEPAGALPRSSSGQAGS